MWQLWGYRRNYSFLITVVSVVCVCVYVCRGRELIIPSLGVHYSNLWDALARSG